MLVSFKMLARTGDLDYLSRREYSKSLSGRSKLDTFVYGYMSSSKRLSMNFSPKK